MRYPREEFLRLTKGEREFYKKKLSDKSALSKARELLATGRLKLFFKLLVNRVRSSLKLKKAWPFEKGANDIVKRVKTFGLKDPFFLFINFMEVHEPYETELTKVPRRLGSGLPLKVVGSDEVGLIETHLKKDYAEEVEYSIDAVERVLDTLDLENTLVVVTSDHGQLLGEQGRFFHSWGTEDELFEVPLSINYPQPVETDEKGRVSLTRLYNLFETASRDSFTDDSFLKSEFVLAENNGLCIQVKPETKWEKKWVETLQERKVVVFEGDQRFVYNRDCKDFVGTEPSNRQEILDRIEFLLGS